MNTDYINLHNRTVESLQTDLLRLSKINRIDSKINKAAHSNGYFVGSLALSSTLMGAGIATAVAAGPVSLAVSLAILGMALLVLGHCSKRESTDIAWPKVQLAGQLQALNTIELKNETIIDNKNGENAGFVAAIRELQERAVKNAGFIAAIRELQGRAIKNQDNQKNIKVSAVSQPKLSRLFGARFRQAKAICEKLLKLDKNTWNQEAPNLIEKLKQNIEMLENLRNKRIFSGSQECYGVIVNLQIILNNVQIENQERLNDSPDEEIIKHFHDIWARRVSNMEALEKAARDILRYLKD